MGSINTINVMVPTDWSHKSNARTRLHYVHQKHIQYLPGDEVLEADQFISVLWVLLSVLFRKERLKQK